MVKPLIRHVINPLYGYHSSSEWSPLDVASLVLLFDPTDLSTMFTDVGATTPVTTTGERVAAWRSKAAGAHLFTESTSANRPVWTSGANPCLLLADAAGQRLTNTMDLTTIGAMTWVFGVTRSTASADQTLVNQGAGGTSSFSCAMNAANTLQATSGGGSLRVTTTPTLSAGVPLTEVLTGQMRLQSTPLVQSRINGVAGTAVTSSQGAGTAYANAAVRLFQRTDGIRPFKGNVYAIAAFSTILSGDDLTNTEAWIAAKAGVTL